MPYPDISSKLIRITVLVDGDMSRCESFPPSLKLDTTLEQPGYVEPPMSPRSALGKVSPDPLSRGVVCRWQSRNILNITNPQSPLSVLPWEGDVTIRG